MKNRFFLQILIIEVMLASPIEIELTNFGYNLSHVIKCFSDIMDRNYDVVAFISKFLYFNET